MPLTTAMPNTAFRISFWVLLVATSALITLALSHSRTFWNPQIAQAEAPLFQRQPNPQPVDVSPVMVAQEPTLAAQPVPESVTDIEPTVAVSESLEPIPDARFEHAAKPPVMVASADPDGPIYFEAPERESTPVAEFAGDAAGDAISIHVPSPFVQGSPEESTAVVAAKPEALPQLQHDLEPIEHEPLLELTKMLYELRDHQKQGIEDVRTAVLANVESIREELGEIRRVQLETNEEAKAAKLEAQAVRQEVTAAQETPQPSVRTPQNITLTSGESEGRWTIAFDEADLTEVFTSLGQLCDWNIVVSPDVAGTFSGEFANADPEQAFAVVIKSQQLSVDRRGNYVMVRQRD